MFFVSQSPDLLLQRNWNHMYVKADHRMSADLISVTWWRGWSGWLSWWFLTSLGFSRSLKDKIKYKQKKYKQKIHLTGTSKTLHQAFFVQIFNEFLRNFNSCSCQHCFHNGRNTGFGAAKWKTSICIWTFRKLVPDPTTIWDNHGRFLWFLRLQLQNVAPVSSWGM